MSRFSHLPVLLVLLAFAGCATPTLEQLAYDDLHRVSIPAPVPVPDGFEFNTREFPPASAGPASLADDSTRTRFSGPVASVEAQLPALALNQFTRELNALRLFDISPVPIKKQFRVSLSGYSVEPLTGGRYAAAVWMVANLVDEDEDSYWYSEASALSRTTFTATEAATSPRILLAAFNEALQSAAFKVLHPPAAPKQATRPARGAGQTTKH